jgi:F-type H+-transporting ATPase subunit a
MMLFTHRKTGNGAGWGRKITRGIASAVVVLGLAGLWSLGPATAQEGHAPAAPHAPAAQPQPESSPAPHGNAADPHAPAAAPAETHGSPAETQGSPNATTDEHGTDAGGRAGTGRGAEGHVPAGDHAEGEAAPGHAAEGEAHEEEAVSIHQPTWITGLLKKIYRSGPTTFSAEGALDENGKPLSAEARQALIGQAIELEWEDHHAPGKTKPDYHIKGTIASIGETKDGHGSKVTINGQTVELIHPEPTFAWEKMFPEALVISLITCLFVGILLVALSRNMKRVPGRAQAALEQAYESADFFFRNLIPHGHKKYMPMMSAFFVYIFCMNVAGIIPGWASPTANINVTAGLAVVIVIFVQIEGIRANGLLGYFKHFLGEPIWLAPLNLPLHIIGEFAKVLSLTIRLFGNIFGEDVVIIILIMLSIKFMGGVPMQSPMYLLALFTSFVQALVFTILGSVYIAIMTAHHEEEGEHGHGDHGHSGHTEHAHATA